jgi:uncharacterized protein (TIGR02453 family)
MATVTAGAFKGFTGEGIQFLTDLAQNNDRAWFQPRKGDYERLLKEPLEALCVALDERFRARGIPMRPDPAKSPFRIYRDVRFAKDKSPYKTNLGAGFPWVEDGAGDMSAMHAGGGLGGYFHFQPGEMFIGGGTWQPESATLAAWRRTVLERGRDVHEALDDPAFVKTFGKLNGDQFKRVPAGAPADHPDVELLKLKQLLFGHRLSDRDVKSAKLPDLITDSFAKAMPVMRLLARLPA